MTPDHRLSTMTHSSMTTPERLAHNVLVPVKPVTKKEFVENVNKPDERCWPCVESIRCCNDVYCQRSTSWYMACVACIAPYFFWFQGATSQHKFHRSREWTPAAKLGILKDSTRRRRVDVMKTLVTYAEPVAVVTPVVASWDIRSVHTSTVDVGLYVYEPLALPNESSTSKLPIMMYFHGGGFCLGSRHYMFQDFCRTMAARLNVILVAVEYRLAPESKFPSAIHDAYAVLESIADETKLNLPTRADRTRICSCGDSAGGQISLVLAQLCKMKLNSNLQMAENENLKLHYLLLLYPVVEVMAFVDSTVSPPGAFLPMPVRRWFVTAYYGDPENAYDVLLTDVRANPTTISLDGLPPMAIISGSTDPVRFENARLCQSLRAQGVRCARAIFEVPHGFAAFSSQNRMGAIFDFMEKDFFEIMGV